MQCVFLGGASGVGASSVAIEIGGQWILVDAGVRMTTNDRLPKLDFLNDKQLAAVFVTHAHADHIGSLPLVRKAFPTVPIYTSPATMKLMRVMFMDALNVMAKRAAEELEVPLYDDALVSATMTRLRPLAPNSTRVVDGLRGVKVSTSHAGHVAGAMSIGFSGPDGRVVISGDLSCAPQRTVDPALKPKCMNPDLLVLESTYGNRSHPDRKTEELRLARAVAEHIANRRYVLIPAFALGRAQEIISILRTSQEKNLIPRFPIWVDGLVRTLCETYTTFPDALAEPIQHRINSKHDPFFNKIVRPVKHYNQRYDVLDGPPCCIISSSGMLTGGPSLFYASQLINREDAALLITGYQDEESPGRKLQNLLKQEGPRTIQLGRVKRQVRCHVATYALSAHADSEELVAWAQSLNPARIALVHGDPDARAALAERIERTGTSVVMAEDGVAIEITPRVAVPGLVAAPAATAEVVLPGVEWSDELLEMIADHAELNSDNSGAETDGVVLDEVGNDDLRLLDEDDDQPKVVAPPVTEPITQFFASQIAREILGTAAIRISVDNGQPNTFVVRFPLPDVDQHRHADALKQVAERTGWNVTVYPRPQQQALVDAVPKELPIIGNPSVYFDEHQLLVQCSAFIEPALRQQYVADFAKATGGWQLVISRGWG